MPLTNPPTTTALKRYVTPGSQTKANTSIAAGDTVTNTAAEMAFTHTVTLIANSLSVGDLVEIGVRGLYSSTVGQTITGRVKINGTQIITTGSVSGIANGTNFAWTAQITLVVLAIGVNGSLDVQGKLEFATAAAAALSILTPNAAAFTIDTTVDQVVSLTAQWALANAANSIQLRQIWGNP